MGDKKILIITEGKDDERLSKKVMKCFIGEDVKFYTYNTTIYDLYNLYKDQNQPFDDLDLQNVLLEDRRKNNLKREEEQILRAQYTDILLIFDFDPHSQLYDPKILKILMKHFNDSTDKGRLLLNYPMLESFLHIKKECFEKQSIDASFLDSKFNMADLTSYKKKVNLEGFRLINKNSNTEKVKNIVQQHIKKSARIIKEPNPLNMGRQENLFRVLTKQAHLIKQKKFAYILSTFSFFLVDLYPHLFFQKRQENQHK